MGRLIEAHGESGIERLQSFLGGDHDLISATLLGLTSSLDRPDLPNVQEILELGVKGHEHFIRPACLAGLELRFNADQSQVSKLNKEILSKAVAFQYTSLGKDPEWFKALVRERPDVVAAVLIQHVLMQIKAKHGHIAEVYPLAHNGDYASVARLAVAPLLHAYPNRGPKKLAFGVLADLLKAALRHLSDDTTKDIIEKKLVNPCMDATQRVYWLAAALVIDSQQYEDALRAFIGKSRPRTQSLASFFSDRFDHRVIREAISESGVASLIGMLAPICSPERELDSHWVSPAMQTAEFVRSLVNRLGAAPTEVANREIHNLLQQSSLSTWHSSLRHALHTQRVSYREATFRHPTVREVCNTLRNRSPANAADLAALITDHLRELASEIRHGNTDQYKQFWNVDQYSRPTEPRPEDACRDSLLERLKDRLRKFGVEAVPEGHYADDKRADIRVSHTTSNASMAIPIEIKRDSHPNLWTAISDQLIDLYTREPESKGRGVFLVFWFGGEKMPAPPNAGRPDNAVQLEKDLISLLPVDKKELISVCVVDCSRGIGK